MEDAARYAHFDVCYPHASVFGRDKERCVASTARHSPHRRSPQPAAEEDGILMSDLHHRLRRFAQPRTKTTLRRMMMGMTATVLATLFAGLAFTGAASATSKSTAPVLEVQGQHVTFNRHVIALTGFTAYGLATLWGDNRGCGGEFSDQQLNQLFSSIAPRAVVRFDAFEGGLGVNPTTGQLDFTGLDRVFAAAERHHIELMPVLANEWGGCDDGAYKDINWYEGGWQQVPDPALAQQAQLPALPLSYHDWVAAVVARYANSPSLGMWEPVGEAEAGTCLDGDLVNGCSGQVTCPDEEAASTALRSFFDDVGAEIRGIDPNHLIEAGLLGGDQCGLVGADYENVIASPGIDVASFHDFYGTDAFGGPQGSSVADRIAAAQAVHKPLLNAETGVPAAAGVGDCINLRTRLSQVRSKANAQLQAGITGFMVWNIEPNQIQGCSLGVMLNDPLLRVLRPVRFRQDVLTW